MFEATHETVSFAAFLEYRARRMQAPIVGLLLPPDLDNTPLDLPEMTPFAVAAVMPGLSRV
jgi:hypothetical protein